MKCCTLFLLLVWSSLVLAQQNFTSGIPTKYMNDPAVDLVHKGKLLLPDEVHKLREDSKSTSRALTAEDTNAYASEIVGADIKSIERAYEGVMKGDSSAFKAVLSKAAAKNEVSPEQMSSIISEMFL